MGLKGNTTDCWICDREEKITQLPVGIELGTSRPVVEFATSWATTTALDEREDKL